MESKDTGALSTAELVLREPTVADGAALWQLVVDVGNLDQNSPYLYLALCRDFADTCIVAERDGKLLGFITGYRPRKEQDVIFVWQVGVSADARGEGLASRLLDNLLLFEGCKGVRFMETTVTPSNEASRRMFHSLAGRLSADVVESDGFTADLFPAKPTNLNRAYASGHSMPVFCEIPIADLRTNEVKGHYMRIFEEMESDVRGYVRSFPAVFDVGEGALLYDEHGNRYIDFFAGAGTLNYGHNNPAITEAMIKYLKANGILHGLDKATVAKRAFLQKLRDTILEPRNLSYKIQFTGPTGTNAVEAALKLARMVKRRSGIISFTDGYHGLTMGALAVTGNYFYRDESYGARNNAAFMPFDGYFGPDVNTIDYLRRFLTDGSSGVDIPAAIIVETIQGEGGINVASFEWLKDLESLCREFDILLIIDDIQVGNGRTGTFFSFEPAGIRPDMITVSKSIGGGLPLAMLLMRPELDQWRPGEHTGTFRGNNLAFVAATEALNYWDNDDLARAVLQKGKLTKESLGSMAEKASQFEPKVRGRGMVWGLELPQPGVAGDVAQEAFKRGLLLETAGADDHVLKFLPPLVTEEELLKEGLEIVEQSLLSVLDKRKRTELGEN